MTKVDLSKPEHAPYVQDYLVTIARIEQDRSHTKSGLQNLDPALAQLPMSNNKVIKLNELVIKPEVFDGERSKPRRWIREYNEAILANGWSNEVAIKCLPTFHQFRGAETSGSGSR